MPKTTNPFFTGTTFEWMEHFINSVPDGMEKSGAFCLALSLHYLSTRNRSRSELVLSSMVRDKFCITRYCMNKNLRYFEDAGLIEVKRLRNSAPSITLKLQVKKVEEKLTSTETLPFPVFP